MLSNLLRKESKGMRISTIENQREKKETNTLERNINIFVQIIFLSFVQ